ncbi:methyltransferase family protein [Celeribacter persicus]|uniref:Methyltransferase family protein n=2 Tax=Celeribacter persicus TaxID=1651082 RepID=A0A2T5HUW6_9RHOB|nr:methyltransferase family protein [Celeribacter persicus]
MSRDMKPEDILPTYERQARAFDLAREKTLFERPWLDRMMGYTPQTGGKRNVLDLGCGSGRPIAQYLSDRRCEVTGVDGAAAMVALFRQNLPRARAIHADMRGLDLGETFDAVVAWDSFFHLSVTDQREMFATFARHLNPRGTLLFTSGPEAGEAIGSVEHETVYHASLSPDEYRQLMADQGMEVIAFTPEDPGCTGHSVWLARKSI